MNLLASSTHPANASAATQQTAAKAGDPKPEVLKAAREFETIFLRSLLGSLEKSTQLGSGGNLKAGQSAYGSMVVGALADTMSGNGGIGLAEIIAKAMTRAADTARGPNKP